MRTWMFEFLFAAAVLAGIALLTGGWVQWLGALAVLASFAHMQVSDRLAEAERLRLHQSVECVNWLNRYLIAKECIWIAFFAATQAYTALAGVPLFLLYPLWRKWWRKRHPIAQPNVDFGDIEIKAFLDRVKESREKDLSDPTYRYAMPADPEHRSASQRVEAKRKHPPD